MSTAIIQYQPIGVIHTPYQADGFCPSQPVEREEGESRIEVFPEYRKGLDELSKFHYVYVLCHLDQGRPERVSMRVKPPWAKGHEAGLFATRSPHRPVPIGLSVVRLKSIEEGTLVCGLMDVFDGTPLLDIKPYIRDLDAKKDANLGWIGEIDDHHHLLDHVRGIAHKHDHHH
jgi:tRNA-Thr(GGU) m(6)t(6)A37 methyltransferase TsaA